MSPNFARLETIITAVEAKVLQRFAMHHIVETLSCGTVGCMIGHYNVYTKRHPKTFGRSCNLVDWKHFGISEKEYNWLFASGPVVIVPRSLLLSLHRKSNGALVSGKWATHLKTNWSGGMSEVTAEQAVARLRKFIAYKKSKHEFIHDSKYGVSDKSRRMEGDHNFVRLALQQMEIYNAIPENTPAPTVG